MDKMKVLVTGAGGYVGSLLISALEQLDAVVEVIGVDLKARPDHLGACTKLSWIQADVSREEWISNVRGRRIDHVIHLAFQIRQLYGAEEEKQRRWNIDGARHVFGFAFSEPTVRRVIHFSTVSAYGAGAANRVHDRIGEETPLAETEYLYARHKKKIEELLRSSSVRSDGTRQVIVLRCASISGPYGRTKLGRFGIVSTLTSVFPLLPCGRADFGRQYLHEDDIVDIALTVLRAPINPGIEVYNASPEDYLTAADLGRLLGKRPFIVPPVLLRMAFAALWRMSRGRIPTPPAAWKFLTYPIAVDGARLTRAYGYRYRFSSREALLAERGRYAEKPEMMEDSARLGVAPSPSYRAST